MQLQVHEPVKNPIPWPIVGLAFALYGANIGVLLLNEYLLAQQLRVQVPAFELRCCSCNESGSQAESKFPEAVAEDLCAVSLLFCFSVVSGNVSLRFLPVSFNQAVGATTPFLTADFAYLMSKKRELWVTHATLAPAVAGITVATKMLYYFFCLFNHAFNNFHLFRFITCVSATAARAFKEKLNSMNLLMHMAPITVLFLLPSTLLMKKNVTGENHISCKRRRENDLVSALQFFTGIFCKLPNFLSLNTQARRLSSSFFQPCPVLGNAKGVVAVVVSILILEILCR
ncbi:putative sugar phosphate/phosphate translocator [Citrus sinensis]|uniref:Sugar phosphate/phosphate translocator n=1 Tax=Citrus sinensis TaxID=2711 RepID=A0ACB8JUJ6_CITSI|nr:putative sugar phosphate/phosphate translocator [Citrus sinensis]